MKDFTYSRAGTSQEALTLIATLPNAKFLGGGTNLVNLMRENIEQPDALIDITRLPSTGIAESANGISIGAEARNTAVANHPLIRQRYPVLSQAILFGASGQIRNMATVGGNIMQRTRCYYFYDAAAKCNKRNPDAGCDAIGGFNRIHAILGASEHCIATHPSDMCVALAALDATVKVKGPDGERGIPFNAFHLLPGDTPHIETALQPNELIASVSCLRFLSQSARDTEGPGSRELRVRSGKRGGGAGSRKWRSLECAVGAGRGGAETVEGLRSREGAIGRQSRFRDVPPCGLKQSSPTPADSATTALKLNSRNALLAAC